MSKAIITRDIQVREEQLKQARKEIRAFERKYGLGFCLNHTGKMTDMWSLSTSVRKNRICQARAKDKTSICSKCYAQRMTGMYHALEAKLAKNTDILTSQIIPAEEWPVINMPVFRLEAFGDLNNMTQAINYINFAKRNPLTVFGLWTKNPQFLDLARKQGHAIPMNLIIGQSSEHVNVVAKPKYDFIKFVFTVFTKEYAEEHNIDINCGARHCFSCLRCYQYTTEVHYVNELLK